MIKGEAWKFSSNINALENLSSEMIFTERRKHRK
jgi:hypothetical protein